MTYSEEECIDYLCEANDRVGGELTMKEFDSFNYPPSAGGIANKFGGWNNAKSIAGLDAYRVTPYNEEEYLSEMRRCASIANGILTKEKYLKHSNTPSLSSLESYFESWHVAKKKAGLTPSYYQISNEECLQSLRDANGMIEGILTASKYESIHTSVERGLIERRFDSWNKAKKRAGLETYDPTDYSYRSGESHSNWTEGCLEYSYKWEEVRRSVLKRDSYQCRNCGKSKADIGRNPDVHHLVPVRLFPNSDNAHFETNAITLCRSCHCKAEDDGLRVLESFG